MKNKRGISVWHMNIFDLISAGRSARVPLKELAVFCRKAAFLLDSGLPVKDAMPVLAQQTQGRVLRSVVSDVHSLIMQGESFSRALRSAGVFPAFMCGYIAIGEKTARLAEVCARLADYYEGRARTEEELAAAMVYPVAVALMMSAVIIMAVTFVLPGYSQIFEASGVALPRATEILLSVSNFFSNNTAIVFGVIFILFVAIIFFYAVRRDEFFLRT
jgi:type IV pilus assembly protein PilC